jgi:hypothetical protein
MGVPQRTSFPTIAGFLIFISACLFIAFGSFGVLSLLAIHQPDSHYILAGGLSSGVLIIVAGVLALIGGIMSLRRRNLILATVGAVSILILSLNDLPNFFIAILSSSTSVSYPFFLSFLLGFLLHLITTILSLLGLIFIGMSKSEFFPTHSEIN